MKQEILDRLNEIIVEEKGTPVTMKSMWTDTGLDSLGTVITIATLEYHYPNMFADLPNDADALATIDFENLTIREIIKKCVLSSNTASPEPA
jgi:acyl carrier protein